MFEPSAKSMQRVIVAAGGPTLPPLSFAAPRRAHAPVLAVAIKRGLDLVVAVLGLVLLALPMLLTALAIRLETPGPVLFRQPRVGRGGRPFVMWKFRTMRDHTVPDGMVRQARRGDPRVTRVGGWLRCRSLDELPQLVNVLRGEMSLVGPRPHAPGTCAGGRPFEQVSLRYPLRHSVRPGMTGLAQIRGWRGETETEEKLLRRVDSDLEYIETWTLWLDLVILLRTIRVVLSGHNAY